MRTNKRSTSKHAVSMALLAALMSMIMLMSVACTHDNMNVQDGTVQENGTAHDDARMIPGV